MFDFLRAYQLNIMLILSGICALTAFFALLMVNTSTKRRAILFALELGAAILLISDRYAYIYRGDMSVTGYWVVRIANFLVYIMLFVEVLVFNFYLEDLYTDEGGLKKIPLRLKIATWLTVAGMVMVVISIHTGIYYTIDEHNLYQRGKWVLLNFAFSEVAVLLQLSVIIQHYKKLSRGISISLILFTVLPLLAGILQYFVYGISLVNIVLVATAEVVYVFALLDMSRRLLELNDKEVEHIKGEKEKMRLLFEQTAEALASAIDAKDSYTRGHSARVAEYAEKIAKLAGKNEQECDEIYYAGLLHDVGKIGIADTIINKEGRLTEEEYAQIKRHPVIGKQILSSISESPYLSVGANYHHERYDGRGYPEGLKGDDIPEIARIIAVADAYDAMTSKRSYRKTIPQQMVREELVKGIETQFDPKFARIMLHLLDMDEEYVMQERDEKEGLADKMDLTVKEAHSVISEGILIDPAITKVRFRCEPAEGYKGSKWGPSFLIFDSLDAKAHETDGKAKEMIYYVYGEIGYDGTLSDEGVRKSKVVKEKDEKSALIGKKGTVYELDCVKYRDHLMLHIRDGEEMRQVIFALPDSTRYAYLGLTGEQCRIYDVKIEKTDELIGAEDIPRIAEEISYIKAPEGDVPNVQIDGWRTAASKGIEIDGEVEIDFHSMSLPTARLLWHCPFVILFYSDNGEIGGPGFKEFALMRMDGEGWEMHEGVVSKISVNKDEDFEGWEVWKARQKEGVDCKIRIRIKDRTVTVNTSNEGIHLKDVTRIDVETPKIYAALSGDQCALTGIKIKKV
ncbi:MAG: HD domain-containing protein [Lachnospiraceae bacterium]|nr:HD domain-containing protein [Lachnospiraceae bacterium]